MSNFPQRHALSRAQFFLAQAESCNVSQREEFEAYLEAAIIFSRSAIHRLQTEHRAHPNWQIWFGSLSNNPTIVFFRTQRDFLLKESSPKIGQIISFNSTNKAADLYYFESPSISALKTVQQHLDILIRIIEDALTNRFSF